MSQSAAEAAPDVLEEIFVKNCVVYSLLALVVYEYAVTTDREINLVWRRKLTAPSLILLLSRWFMLLGPITGNIPLTSMARYQAVWNVNSVAFVINQLVVASFSALRVYAILMRTRMRYVIPVVVGVLGLTPIATNSFKWSRATLVLDPPSGYEIDDISQSLGTTLLYLTRISAIAVETIVLVTTWTRSYKHFQQMRRLGLQSSVTMILLRDGTVYFVILLVINLCQLATFQTTSVGGSYADLFMQYLPPLLVQRFMMNLRQLTRESSEAHHAPGRPVSTRSVRFRAPSSFLGNIGEPLEHGASHEQEDDYDAESDTPPPGSPDRTKGNGDPSISGQM